MMSLPLILILFAAVCIVVVLAVALWPKTAEEVATSQTGTANSPSGTASENRTDQTINLQKKRDKSREQIRERLIHAGLYNQNSTTHYYMFQAGFMVLPIIVGMVCYYLGFVSAGIALLIGIGTGITGVVAPGLWLDYLKSKRQTTIRRAIPDALDVITICVESGLSLSASLVRVANELNTTYPMLATELTIVHRQIQMGKSTGQALRSFAERFDLEELRSLSSVVQQSEKFGASISSALRVHGDSLRTRRMQKAEEKAQKAAVKILIPTLLCIFPALFVVILGPAAYDVMELMDRMVK